MDKNIIFIFLCVSLVIGMNTVFANPTTLYVDPSSIIDLTLEPGDTFQVNVSIADVVDLAGYEFKLGYNTNVLNVTSVVISPDFPSFSYCLRQNVYPSEGYVWVACMLPLGTQKGVDGSGSLRTITFQVVGNGESSLDLYRTVLGDHTGKSISHEVIDGYFTNVIETTTTTSTTTSSTTTTIPEETTSTSTTTSTTTQPETSVTTTIPSGGGGGARRTTTTTTSSTTTIISRETTTVVCEEEWECTEWSECVNETQTRECRDLNECGTIVHKPEESRTCPGQKAPTGLGITGMFTDTRMNIVLLVIVIIVSVIIGAMIKKFTSSRRTPE